MHPEFNTLVDGNVNNIRYNYIFTVYNIASHGLHTVSLQSSLNFINTFSKNTVRIRPDNGATASPGDATEFSVPNNTIVDLSSLAVHKTVTTATAACTGSPFSECLSKHYAQRLMANRFKTYRITINCIKRWPTQP